MILSENWRPADRIQLEPNADEAVRELDKNLALTAGPGAGKTELLAQRADFLFRTGTCRYPRRILAISFKVDAARNLKERVQRRCGFQLASRLDSHTFHAFAKRLIDRYRPVLTGINRLDVNYTIGENRLLGTQITFADLVPLAVEILHTSAHARGALQQTYSHLFLDEFQDCTSPQYELIREAFRGSATVVTAVGDTKQRIMGWAGALEGIFEQFARDFEAKPLNLYQNFRSQPVLRRMQNRMIEVMDPKGVSPAVDLQGDDGEITVKLCDDEIAEAEYVVTQIERWIRDGTPVSEIAVLVSKQPQLYTAEITSTLESRGIPFRNEQEAQDLTAEPIAILIFDLLRVVFDDSQSNSYVRLMSIAVGTASDEETSSRARRAAYRYVHDVRREVRGATFRRGDPSEIRRIVYGFLRLMGRENVATLSSDYQQGRRLDDLISKTLSAFYEQLAIAKDPVGALRRLSETDAVRILTIHKSKGLEFENVVITAVEEETFFGDPDAERSAFFVGISRAKRRLVLTAVRHRARPLGHKKRWDAFRNPHEEFLAFAGE